MSCTPSASAHVFSPHQLARGSGSRRPFWSRLTWLGALLSAVAFAACGEMMADGDDVSGLQIEATAQEDSAIINGEACAADAYPTAVAVLVDAEISLGGLGTLPIKTVLCTGTLIAPDVVLTAAHCLDVKNAAFGFGEVTREQYYVSFTADLVALADQTSQDFPPGTIEASDWIANPDFDIQNLDSSLAGPGDYSDLGLIFLSTPVTDRDPEVVITSEEADQLIVDSDVFIVGWGQQTVTAQGEQPPSGTVGVKICAPTTVGEMGDTEFQVGTDANSARKCHGDSGGPTYMNVDTPAFRKERVVGITSHAYDQEDCVKGGVDTRVSSYLEWIDGQMTSRCEDGTRAWCDVNGLIPPSFYDPPAEPDPSPNGSDAGPSENEDSTDQGCGCSSTGSAPVGETGLAAAFGLLVFLRRRRR